jgi:hypothetical protein
MGGLPEGAKAFVDYLGLSNESILAINDALIESNSLVSGIVDGVVAFREKGKEAFDMTASVGFAVFEGLMGAVDELGKSFAESLFSGANILISMGKTVAKIVQQIITDLIAAIAKALIFQAIMAATGKPLGFIDALGKVFGLAGGGTAKMSKGGAVAGGQPPAVPRGPLLSFMAPLIRLAQGGSLPLGGGFAPAAPPLLRGVSGFTVPGAVQTFDSVPALLAPGEAVLPTVNGRRPADIVSRLEGMEKSLTAALTALSRGSGGGRTSNVTINTLDYSSFRQAIRSGAFRDEQDMAFELGR